MAPWHWWHHGKWHHVIIKKCGIPGILWKLLGNMELLEFYGILWDMEYGITGIFMGYESDMTWLTIESSNMVKAGKSIRTSLWMFHCRFWITRGKGEAIVTLCEFNSVRVENGHWVCWFSHRKMAIFHSYVSSPEGTNKCWVCLPTNLGKWQQPHVVNALEWWLIWGSIWRSPYLSLFQVI